MSLQPIPTDYVELWVEDDGDIILCKRQKAPSGGLNRNLYYEITKLEELAAELNSYGCDKKALKKAILQVSFENYNKEVIVK